MKYVKNNPFHYFIILLRMGGRLGDGRSALTSTLPVQCQIQTTETQSHYYKKSVNKLYLINM